MASKKALKMAFDGGQAAQRYGDPEEVNPFDPRDEEDEHAEWLRGHSAELEEKWTRPGGRPHLVAVSDQ